MSIQTPAQRQSKRLRGKVEKLEDEIFALKRLLGAYNEEIVKLQREHNELPGYLWWRTLRPTVAAQERRK